MEPEKPAFSVGQRVTVIDRDDRPLRFVRVDAVKKRPQILVLSDGSEWDWDGWRPYRLRAQTRAFYTGPRLRAYDAEDQKLMDRHRAIQAVRAASAEDLERLPTELLVQVAAALAAAPEDPDAD